MAESSSSKDRVIFYVRLDTRRVDGLSRSLARQRYRNSVIVDAQTLGPLPRKRRRPKRTPEQRFYIARWRIYYQKTWQQMLANQAPCGLLARTWWERWFALPCFSRATMMRSETDIQWIRAGTDYNYVREAVIHPEIPNFIHSTSLADERREVLGFARIAPVVQADAGLAKWCQRVWYLDHKHNLDGIARHDDYRGCVVPDSITPGIDSVPFDGRGLRREIDYIVRGTYGRLADDYLHSIGASA